MATVLPPPERPGIFTRFFANSFPGGGEPRTADDRRMGPFRGELLGAEGLAAHARALARRQRLSEPGPRAPRRWFGARDIGPLLTRLNDTEKLLEEAREALTSAADRDMDVSAAGDWLLDNFYVVQEHIRDIRQNLPGSYYQELPKLADGPLATYPRVYELAIELIAHTEGHLDLENIGLFVREFQDGAVLNMGELWAIPTMLRVGLVENIRRLALRVLRRLEELEAADRWAAQLQEASKTSPRALTDALGDFVDNHPRLTPMFVARLYQQLRGYQAEFRKLLWLEQWIAEEALSPEDAVSRSNQRLALTQVMMANHLTSLRRIARLDWDRFFESQSVTEAVLREDPSGHYTHMTFDTRDHYRHVVEDIARRGRQSEEDVARQAVNLAATADPSPGGRAGHIGFYLIDRGRLELERASGYRMGWHERLDRALHRHPDLIYFGGIALITMLIVAGLFAVSRPGTPATQALLLLLSLLPASEIATSAVNQIITVLVPPRRLPKMELRENGIPADLRTIVAVPTLLSSVEVVREQLEHLEIQYLANREPNLHFAILSDFTDAPAEHADEDAEILAAAVEGITALNRVYGAGAERTFYLFHRPRVWSPRQGVWMGWERKRGKLALFNRFLRGGSAEGFSTVVGDVTPLRGTRYVITLDSDTVLPHDAAELLIGTLAHPLNRAVYDPQIGRVVHGYGILQPRVGVALASAYQTRFAIIHSGHPGVDPYTTAVSDVYQDLYGEGSFTGKGIYDVAVFEQATQGRFPDDALLSHDLIEGAFARAALVTDVELYDDYPGTYLSHARRKHRWIRGDWQLLPWLRSLIPAATGSQANPLSTISRWKIFDNLRRSLVELGYLALFVAGWTVLPGSPLAWTAIVVGAMTWPWLLATLLALINPPRDNSWRGYYAAVGRDSLVGAQQFGLTLAFLAHQAAASFDAIARTVWRLLVSRRNLLEWQSASQVERSVSQQPREAWRRMMLGLLLALAAGAAAWWAGAGFVALPFVALWLGAPALANRLSEPPVKRELRLGSADRSTALSYALLHWRFFEQFVGVETQWLAPDNFQATPEPVVAARTSATNIGLQLLSIVTARDLGFITTGSMIERLELVFRTLERMRRYRGHFFNWYALRDLSVLEPAYISTVDSGNLAGHLLALKQACLSTPSDGDLLSCRLEALQAAVELALETLPRKAAPPARTALQAAAEALNEAAGKPDPALFTLVRDHARVAGRALEGLGADDIGRMADARWWAGWIGVTAEAHAADFQRSPEFRIEEETRLAVLSHGAHEYAVAMDFTLVFDSRRKLFSIGYQEATGTLDDSYYDLLASEARLGSFVAIAKADITPEHWFRLGRSLTIEGGDTALVSWAGSMFEYLMPMLVMRSLPFTLLEQTHRGAVARHIAYGRDHNTPWGMSESGYNVRDRHGTYQYRAFGVPDLALKRGLSRDLVIAPYATLLALQVEPAQAMENLDALTRVGALGPYGFREAIDYTRTNADEGPALVDAYMAHHIGMGLVALGNVLRSLLWQERFHSDALVRSAELLLGERIPRRFVTQEPQPDAFAETRERGERERPAVREFTTADTRQPAVALLGTLPYTVMLTNAGSGYSRHEAVAVTRWRADATRDHHGQWCYIRDLESGEYWSAGHQPVCKPADEYHAVFAADRASFHRRDGDIETRMEVAVVPDDRAEVRRITLTNHAWTARELELTSYGEIVLAPPDADAAHPAFGNLFVETEWLTTHRAILASRRPRSDRENRLWCVHVAAVEHREEEVGYETDRARFIGRGRSAARPAALDPGAELSGSVGPVLDPIFSLRVKVRIPPGRSARVAFTTLVNDTRDRAVELADRYNDLYGAQRAFDLSWTRSQMELQDIGASPADAALFQQLAGHLLYPHAAVRAPAEELERNTRSQEALWPHGISGDLPILLALIDSVDGLPSVAQLLRAHYYWRMHGLAADLVILNTMPPTYLQELNEELLTAVRASSEAGLLDQPGGVFLRRQDLLSADDVALLRTVARVHVVCDGVGLGALRDLPEAPEEYPPALEIGRKAARTPPRTPTLYDERRTGDASNGLALFNGLGGLTADLDYEIRLRRADLPPAPWANVVANPHAGFIVSESGGGFTWAENSFFYRLTPWRNDPVSDAPGEVLYLRDEETGEIWTPTPSPIRHESPYVARHSAGASHFTHQHRGIETLLALGMPVDDPVKISRLTLTNRGTTPRRLTVTSYTEWTLGVNRERTHDHVRTRFDRATGTLFARNHFDQQFTGRVAFVCMSARLTSHTADRREFIGRNGDLSRPAALGRQALSERVGADLDPCAALQTLVKLAPGESVTLVVLLGAADSETAARALIDRHRTPEKAAAAVDAAVDTWRRRLATITVRTPVPSFDAILNRWMPYQALSCRMWARSGVYQSSGAYGFRDQLQDGMAFVYADPGITRAHLITAAGRQFLEGDVQHWWHPQSGRGVRTRISDDLVWLPYCADHYITVSGDHGVLDAEAPFLRMRVLGDDEHEIYDLPQDSGERGTLYEHCLRALRRASTRGPNGLPLIGSGDWNDGMNRVGIEGRGESVWLAWFLIDTLRRFAARARERGDVAADAELIATAAAYQEAVERSGWDGEWYRRAYFDDGTPLGSAQSDECRIDSIAQTWSVISGAGDPVRAQRAMASLEQHLVRPDARLLMLLTPPFNQMPQDPGYIKGYLPGVRENGAQYTHAALWAVLATALRGDGDRAFTLFQMINPLMHARTPVEVGSYKVEPYVVCSDVYTAEHHVGRGGWTWYTGSASWMYRVGLEAILGFKREADTLWFDPCVPKEWDGFGVEYRHGETIYAVTVRNPAHVSEGVAAVRVDGQLLPDGRIALVDDGRRREIDIEMG